MNEVLMAAFVAASILALFFYMENKAARRENSGLMRTIAFYEKTITEEEDLLNDSDDDNAEQSSRFQSMLGIIIQKLEFLMSALDDVKAEQSITDAKVDAVKTDVETLLAKLAAVPVAGMTPEQEAAVADILTHAKAINDKLTGVDAAANPAAVVVDPAAPAA